MDYTLLSDDELIRKSEEDVGAFGFLYEKYFPYITNHLRSRFRLSEHDAEDIAQKSFIKAHAHLKDFQFKSSFKTWIFSIAKNASLDLIKSRNYNNISLQSIIAFEDGEKQVEFEDTGTLTPYETLADKDSHLDFSSKIARAKESLNNNQRQIFDLVFVEKKGYKEVADILGCPIGTVMSRVFFTRKKLARLDESVKYSSED